MMPAEPHLFSLYDKPMWDSIAAGAMRLQRCTANGRFRYPPGPVCPDSLSSDYTWEPISGRGTLLSWTIFHRQYLPAYPAPHTVVAVQLEEGPIMIGSVDPTEVASLVIDGAVELVYGDHPDGYRIPRFRMARAAR